MAGADAGQRLEAMPTVRTGCNFAVPNRPAVSTPAATTCWRWYQSLAAGGLIYDHVSTSSYTQCTFRDQYMAVTWNTGAAPRGNFGERKRGMVGTCTAHWTPLTRVMAFIVGFLLLLWGGTGNAAEAPN